MEECIYIEMMDMLWSNGFLCLTNSTTIDYEKEIKKIHNLYFFDKEGFKKAIINYFKKKFRKIFIYDDGVEQEYISQTKISKEKRKRKFLLVELYDGFLDGIVIDGKVVLNSSIFSKPAKMNLFEKECVERINQIHKEWESNYYACNEKFVKTIKTNFKNEFLCIIVSFNGKPIILKDELFRKRKKI